MSLWSRLSNVFRGQRVADEIDEELRAHLEAAVEAGRDPAEARRALGSSLRLREQSLDSKLASWLDSLRADAVFGSRLLWKNRVASGAAILSLALTIGTSTAAFRLIDAILLRPLPVAHPERLHVLTYQFKDQNGKPRAGDSFDYPLFRQLRASIGGGAELFAVSNAGRVDLTYSSDQEMEPAFRQYVSGWTFSAFGLQPSLGRLLTAEDDRTPGAHPVAVLSHDYWNRRMGGDPKVIGRTFRQGNDLYEIVGVGPAGFTGTQPGTITDIFVPTMMNASSIGNANWGWIRVWVQLRPEASPETVRQQLAAGVRQQRLEKVKSWTGTSPKAIDAYVNAEVGLPSAASGASGIEREYRKALLILGALAGLLLLIACANVANLMLAQAAARAQEMALRVSIGAGRARLVQLVLMESALMALAATLLGSLFAWWSAPFVVSLLNPPDNPVRLLLPADWRFLAFEAALTAAVIFLFGLVPALRASGVQPIDAMRGGGDPHGRRLMNGLVLAQVAFCFLIHFVAGLFVTTFDRLSHEPLGFSAERLLALEVVSKGKPPAAVWEELAGRMRSVPGVERVSPSEWALLGGNAWTTGVRRPGQSSWDAVHPYVLSVAPGWLDTMGIPLRQGRDLRSTDNPETTAIVNEAFVKRYFANENPVGRTFERSAGQGKLVQIAITGVAADALYEDPREGLRPTIYMPFELTPGPEGARDRATYMVKTASADPLALAGALRQQVHQAGLGLRVSSIDTQQQIVDDCTTRERLLALLSRFFAAVALLLAGVGLYGVLNYSVVQRRREIGIRMALGAQPAHVAWKVTAEVAAMLVLGSGVGLVAGLGSERYLETLLYAVKATDWMIIATPVATLLVAAVLAALPPLWHAIRVDPARVLRAE
ncbi:MAG: ABC transporter permease [Acidobacteria bacterium]|nr:ABC transporter permease [Acidobacteriota bacterium]